MKDIFNISNSAIDPVYYKDRLMRCFGCKTEVTLLKRLARLGIPYIVDGKDIYVLYEHIREAFKPEEKRGKIKTESNILSEL